MVQIGSAVGYADSERTIEQSSLDGSSGRCGEGLLVILTTERSGLSYLCSGPLRDPVDTGIE